MLAPEYWPQIPDAWQEISAQLDTRLEASPALDADFFTPRQQECIGFASEGEPPSAASRSLVLSKNTIKTHLRCATERFREIQPELNDEVPGTGRKPRIYQHRLVYVSLDNKIIPIGDEMDPAELTPSEALILKGLALGETVGVAAARLIIWGGLLTQTVLPEMQEKMGASSPAGIMGNSYRMRLYVPRGTIEASAEPEAVNS